MCPFLMQSNKSHPMPNSLKMCAPRRERLMCQKKILATNISEILFYCIPVKYKNLSCPTITCTIGWTEISCELLGLGASIKLLPLSVYQQLGLGKPSLTQVTIQLVDRLVNFPRGNNWCPYPSWGVYLPYRFYYSWDPTIVKSEVSNSHHPRMPFPHYCQCNHQL